MVGKQFLAKSRRPDCTKTNAIYAVIQDGPHHGRITVFGKTQDFIKIALSHSFQDKCFSCVMQKIKMATKNGRKTILGTKCQMTVLWGSKISLNSLYLILLCETNTFLRFMQEFKMATKIVGKQFLTISGK